MKVDTLKDLESAFAQWRQTKKYSREPTPDELLARARRATKKHGLTAVVRATGVDRTRLFRNAPLGKGRRGGTREERRTTTAASRSVAAFSRVEVSAPSAPSARPLAEVETGTGVKLRVFEETPEMLTLLSAACGFGGVR